MEEESTHRRLTIFMIVFVSLAVIFSSATFYVMSSRPSQSFIGLGLYTQGGLQDYIPAGNLTVPTGHALNWTFAITNRMNKAEFVTIITRIGNQSTPTPNATTPSTTPPEPDQTERFVNDGATLRANFTWKIISTYQSAGLVYLNVSINGRSSLSSAPVGMKPGGYFRLIFELWKFDPVSGSFQYGYPAQASQVGTWLQVWFKAS